MTNNNVFKKSLTVTVGLLTLKSNFKPSLVSDLGKGGQAKVFKATFHGKDVAMKFIPLELFEKRKSKKKPNQNEGPKPYQYKDRSYGCHEFVEQEKFWKLQ